MNPNAKHNKPRAESNPNRAKHTRHTSDTNRKPKQREQNAPKTQNQNIQDEESLEVLDMLCVALHFAGLKEGAIEQALDAYMEELDSFDDDDAYGQEQMIEIIKRIRSNHPTLFDSPR